MGSVAKTSDFYSPEHRNSLGFTSDEIAVQIDVKQVLSPNKITLQVPDEAMRLRSSRVDEQTLLANFPEFEQSKSTLSIPKTFNNLTTPRRGLPAPYDVKSVAENDC